MRFHCANDLAVLRSCAPRREHLLQTNAQSLTLLVRVIDVEHRQVISVDVGEAHLGLVRLFLGVTRPHEALRN